MSGEMNSPGTSYESSNSLPGWVVSGVLGLAVGAGATVLGMYGYGYRLPETEGRDKVAPAAGMPMPAMAPPGGMPGPGGPPMGMGMGGMGMGGMGGGNTGKRNLAALVGKLELLSRPNLNMHLDLDAEQAQKIATRLEELEKLETMTGDEAQTHLDALEELLTAEQKETVGLIGLPGGGGGRGGPPGGAPPGAGGGMPMGMMGMGGPPPDANPFLQEANQKRLRDLLGRLAPPTAPAESESE